MYPRHDWYVVVSMPTSETGENEDQKPIWSSGKYPTVKTAWMIGNHESLMIYVGPDEYIKNDDSELLTFEYRFNSSQKNSKKNVANPYLLSKKWFQETEKNSSFLKKGGFSLERMANKYLLVICKNFRSVVGTNHLADDQSSMFHSARVNVNQQTDTPPKKKKTNSSPLQMNGCKMKFPLK